MSGLPAHLLPLLRPEAYPHAVADLRLIETHISWVLLTGELAYKLKRPVHYPFVDLRSAERRAFLCAEEVRLNRRFAPQLYLGVGSLVMDGQLRISDEGAEGVVLEHVVRMRQFKVQDTLDRLVESRRVVAAELEAFGWELAAIHAGLPRVEESSAWGSVDGVRAQLNANAAECRQFAEALGTAGAIDPIVHSLGARLRALEQCIASRREQQRVRECHGDLHARNVVRHQGRLLAFDCLEFEPAFRWIDVADEVAFLWMDLAAMRREDLAHAFLAGYLARSGDFGLCRLLSLYGVHRALVRAKVSALEACDTTHAQVRTRALDRHRGYLGCARALLAPATPRMVLMTGFSGSGKTWLAQRLAPLLGAIHVRSDVERKRISGLAPDADSHSDPGRGLYSPDESRRIYQYLAHCADDVLAGGFSTLVDATFLHRAQRALFRELAQRRGCPLVVVHCDAPSPVLRSRIQARREQAIDASEADLAVLDWQMWHSEPVGEDESFEIIEADTTRESIVADLCQHLGSRPAR